MNSTLKTRAGPALTIRGSLRVGFAALIAAALASAAAAQTVPVPKPAPKARAAVPPSVSDAQAKAPLTTAATTIVPDPIIPDPRRNVPANIFASFDANQKAQAAKVSLYLSSLSTLVGNFVQVGPDGTKTKGDFYIQKPGKVRFEYDPPTWTSLMSLMFCAQTVGKLRTRPEPTARPAPAAATFKTCRRLILLLRFSSTALVIARSLAKGD